MDYRVRIIDNLNRAAIAAQNDGRWDTADNYLSLASRYEVLWASLDAGKAGVWWCS